MMPPAAAPIPAPVSVEASAPPAMIGPIPGMASAHPREESDAAAQHPPAERPARRTFGGLGSSPLCKLLLLLFVAHGDPDLLLGKSGGLQSLNAAFGGGQIGEQTDDCLTRDAWRAGFRILLAWCH